MLKVNCMKNDVQIKRGDIVELSVYNGGDSMKDKKYKDISNTNPDILVVMKIIDETTLLVAICKFRPRKSMVAFRSNIGDVYIQTKRFYTIDLSFIKSCNISLMDPYEAREDLALMA